MGVVYSARDSSHVQNERKNVTSVGIVYTLKGTAGWNREKERMKKPFINVIQRAKNGTCRNEGKGGHYLGNAIIHRPCLHMGVNRVLQKLPSLKNTFLV